MLGGPTLAKVEASWVCVCVMCVCWMVVPATEEKEATTPCAWRWDNRALQRRGMDLVNQAQLPMHLPPQGRVVVRSLCWAGHHRWCHNEGVAEDTLPVGVAVLPEKAPPSSQVRQDARTWHPLPYCAPRPKQARF